MGEGGELICSGWGSAGSSCTEERVLETWASDDVRCVIRFLWVREAPSPPQCGTSVNDARCSEVTRRAPQLMMAPVGQHFKDSCERNASAGTDCSTHSSQGHFSPAFQAVMKFANDWQCRSPNSSATELSNPAKTVRLRHVCARGKDARRRGATWNVVMACYLMSMTYLWTPSVHCPTISSLPPPPNTSQWRTNIRVYRPIPA